MTEEILRNSLEEAKQRDQDGILIWSDWKFWVDNYSCVKPGNENYDYAVSQILKGEDATISTELRTCFIAVPTKKMLSSDYFSQVLRMCEDLKLKGPVTLIPENKLAESC